MESSKYDEETVELLIDALYSALHFLEKDAVGAIPGSGSILREVKDALSVVEEPYDE